MSQDALLSMHAVDRSRDLVVYGDTVVIRGNLELPGRTVKIFAIRLEGEDDASGVPPGIDVTGEAGAPVDPPQYAFRPEQPPQGEPGRAWRAWWPFWSEGGEPGKPGRPGADGPEGKGGNEGRQGGTIALHAPQIASRLRLVARGGDGSRGQQGADGGPGGNGGTGGAWEHTARNFRGAPTTRSWGTSPSGEGGTGGRGGRGGVGGNGGTGGDVTVRAGSIAPGTEPLVDARGGSPGPNGDSGAGAPGGLAPEVSLPGMPSQFVRAAVRAPSGGQDVQIGAGQAGRDGTSRVDAATAAELVVAASPTHLDMLLQRFRERFVVFGVNANASRTLCEELARLVPLLDAAAELPDAALPADWSSRDRAALLAVAQEAFALNSYFANGQDAFGHRADMAPLPSYAFFDALLEDELSDLETVETRLGALRSELGAQEERITSLVPVINGSAVLASAYEKRIRELTPKLPGLGARILEARNGVGLARDALAQEERNLEAAIEAKFNWSWKEAIAALEMVCFCPPWHGAEGVGMTLAQAAKVLERGFSTIADDDGVTVEKSYLVSRIHVLEGDLLASLRSVSATTDATESAKALVRAEQYEELLAKFTGLAGTDQARLLVHALADAIRAKNDAVLEYNGVLAQLRDAQARRRHLDEEITSALRSLSTKSDPNLPVVEAFVARLYQQLRDGVVARVHQANRAYCYWALDPAYNVFEETLSDTTHDASAWQRGDVAGCLDHALLTACRSKLRSKYSDVVTHVRTHLPTPFPENAADTDGLQLFIDDPASIAQFKATKSLFVRLSWLPREGARRIPAFSDMYDVRLTGIRVLLHGAQHPDPQGIVTIHVEHAQEDTLYTHERRPITFTHEVALEPYSFRYRPNRNDERVSGGEISAEGIAPPGASGAAPYAGIGPFTRWRVSAPAGSNEGLDLSGLTRIELQFRGYNRELSKARQQQPLAA